jgi:protocatechuate 3,4-dioxygenase beta subunit
MHDNPPLANVRRDTLRRSPQLSIFLLAAIAAQATAQTILVDNFNDGIADGWTTVDSTVGQPYGPGTFDANIGAYHLEGGGLVPEPAPAGGFLASFWDHSADGIFTDGFLRTTVRAETEGTLASLSLRTSGSLETGIDAYLFSATTAHGGSFFFQKVVGSRSVQGRSLPPSLSFGVNEDWNIEAGAVGDELSMKVWRVGDPEPEEPQLKFTDRSFRAGEFGVESNIHENPYPGPARVSATFDDVHFRFSKHEDVFDLPPYDIYLWDSPMPVPQVEGPFFTPGSPEKPDMRGDVVTAEDWPDLRIAGQVTDPDGRPIPGLKLDFWQVDDQGSYDNSGGYDLRGHLFTDDQGNYELWTVMPAAYETIRTRHMHAKIGGENLGFDSWAYTTQLYFPEPYDNDINADGTPDKVIEGGVRTDIDALALKDDFITRQDLDRAGAEFSDLVSNILTLNNDPLVEGYFDATLNIVMPDVFQVPIMCDFNGDQLCDGIDIDQLMTDAATGRTDTDLNADGIVDNADRDQWLALAGEKNGFAGPLLVGDSNINGTVDALDLNALALSWQDPDDHNWSSGNFSVAGGPGVNATDLNALALNWRASSAAADATQAVPESNTFGLILLGIAMGWRMFRHRTAC